jgi:serine protease Do
MKEFSKVLMAALIGLAGGAGADDASTTKGAEPVDGHTYVKVTDKLDSLSLGRVPTTLEELQLLEQQFVQVIQTARACTVAVRIGNAQGSGVIVRDGYVLTAAHVAMRPGLSASLTMADGRVFQGKTLGMNRSVDAGLIKIDHPPADLRYVTLGASSGLRPGMWCLAVGHPGGLETGRAPVIRAGRILSTRDKSIITDCALISGDSGGPLYDVSGRLIAVHSRIGNDLADNIHVPIDFYRESWDRMAKGEAWGYLPGFRPIIGVRRNTESERALVASVAEGSPAERAGIQAGDIVVRFGERAITSFPALISAVDDTMPGEHIVVEVERNSVLKRLLLVIGRDPNN